MKRWVPIFAIFLILCSCDLFTPREPDPPIDSDDPYSWKPPTTPEIVLENLSNAFPAGKRNYYLDVLKQGGDVSQGFVFVPDPSVASAQPGVFDMWGFIEEESFLTKLFDGLNDEGLQRLVWLSEQVSPVGELYEIVAEYQLTLSYAENSSALPVQLKGQATLTLEQNEELLYEVSSWSDLSTDTLACWTDLKALVQ